MGNEVFEKILDAIDRTNELLAEQNEILKGFSKKGPTPDMKETVEAAMKVMREGPLGDIMGSAPRPDGVRR